MKPARSPFILAALAVAAALPWAAVFSGIVGFYVYVLVLVPEAGRVLGGSAGEAVNTALFYLLLIASAPLAVALLVILPAGLAWAAFRHPLQGWPGRVVRWCCVISMAFAATYAALTIGIMVYAVVQEGIGGIDRSILGMTALLLFGLFSTWKAWRWLANLPECTCQPG